MNIKYAWLLGFILLVASIATAQIPCSGTILPKPTLFVNWPQFQYDAAHTGCNPYESILKPNNVANVGIKWQHEGEPGGSDFSGSVVADGVLYAVAYGGHGDYTSSLGALNASTGTILWTYSTIIPFDDLTSPAIANGRVYVGASDNNVDALDAKTGALLWQYATSGPIYYPPTVVDGVVYVGSQDNNIYALNAATGALVWKYTTGGMVNASAAVANGMVYIGSDDNNLYALNASTGQLVWSYTMAGGASSAPSVASGKVYVGADQVYALNATTGALVWKYPAQSSRSTPAFARGVLYVSSYQGSVYALNASTGAVIWSHDGLGFYLHSPVVANGVVYVSSGDYPAIAALDISTGTLLWSAYGGNDSSSLTVVNGMVYFGMQDINELGHLYAFSLNGQ